MYLCTENNNLKIKIFKGEGNPIGTEKSNKTQKSLPYILFRSYIITKQLRTNITIYLNRI